MSNLNRYEVTIFWCDREKTKHTAMGINESHAIDVAVRVNSKNSNELYNHPRTEKSVKLVDL